MKRRTRAVLAAHLMLLGGAALSCSSSSPTGGVRQACYGDGGCNPGLVCLSQICVQPDTGTGGNGGGGGAAGSGGVGGAAGAGGHAGAAGSAGLATLAQPVGPLVVASGTESTECATVALGNTGHSMIRRIRANFGAGLVHAIVYKSTATTASALAPCTDFAGADTASSTLHPIFESNQSALELDFPSLPTLTGPDVADQQMVTIEIHGSDRGDTTGTPLSLSGEIDVDVIPFPAGGTASDLMLTGATTGISIPADATLHENNVLFQPVDSAINIFALSTTQHHLGVEFKIWQATSATVGSQAAIVDDTNAIAPGIHSFSTPLSFTSGSGLALQCSWVNNTGATVRFGTGSGEETCFIWQYYAPASGYHLCLDGTCQL